MSYVSTLIGKISGRNQQAHAQPAVAVRRSRAAIHQAVETLEGRQLLSAVSISNATITEGGSLLYNVTLNQASNKAVTVNYKIAGGTAVSGRDYISKAGKITFAAHQTSSTLTIKTKDNKIFSTNKTVLVDLYGVSAGNTIKGKGVGTGTITNIDAAPTISVANAKVKEGNAGTTILTFTVKMTGTTSDTPVKINYATQNDTALAGSDYNTAKGVLSFTSTSKTQTVKVAVRGDKTKEANEAFLLNFTVAKGSTAHIVNPLVPNKTYAVGIITNDDGGAVSDNTTIQALPSTVSINPGSTAGVTLTLNHVSANPITIHYSTSNGTALAGTDYNAVSDTTITFNPGEVTKTVTVGTLSASFGGTFNVNLSSPTSATIGSSASSTVTITNIPLPSLSVSDLSISEGNAGTKNAAVTVSLSSASSQPVTVSYSTSNGTATAGSDYTATTGMLTFNPGQTSQVVNIPIIGDTTSESDETFTVVLGQPVNASVTKAFGTVTITNDDGGNSQPTTGTGVAFNPGPTGFNINIGTTRATGLNYSISNSNSAAITNAQIEFFFVPVGTDLDTASAFDTENIGTIGAGQTVTGTATIANQITPHTTSTSAYYARVIANGVVYTAAVTESPTFGPGL
ncbi:MAG TPA: Calx-beta domain-containing protein [Tepidisphaeraceae bacterium]|nr:Calx-beta domain-containing protein [Tepidisphaeraceae bacterium]